jgi:hypothetical protein
VEALGYRRDTVLVEATYANETRMNLVALRPDGSVDPRVARRGHALIQTPWRGSNADETSVSVLRADSRHLLVVAGYGRHRMQMLRLRF